MSEPAGPSGGLLDRKSVERIVAEGEGAGYRRSLGAIDLTSLGIAAIIGAGIFVLLGEVARETTGPAVVLSIVVGGVAAGLTALSFAELSAAVPVSGSVYTYAFAALGRLPAFLVGWFTLNAYAVGNMVVAVGWSDYFASGMEGLGLAVPERLLSPPEEGGLFDLPAALVMLLVTLLCLPKVRESALVNNLLVALKLGVVALIVGLGAFLVEPANWRPFSPEGAGGVMAGASVLLFAYFGFDTVAAAGGEARRPRRDLPIGILASLAVCTLAYIAMGAVLTGMQPAATLAERAPTAEAFTDQGYAWAGGVITVGALAATATVLFAFHLALARILQSMASDGFLPRRLARLHASTGTPWAITIVTGVLTALGAGLFTLETVASMSVEATVAMYVLVSAGVLILKRVRPDLARPFRTHWTVPLGSILVLLAIVGTGTDAATHWAFAAYVGLGLVVYGFYGHRASLRAGMDPPRSVAVSEPGAASPERARRQRPRGDARACRRQAVGGDSVKR